MTLKPWIEASRPRTLPLSLACIGMGAFLAAYHGAFDSVVFLFCILTTVFLQILSNLSNDYGDSIHGADSANRQGPSRAVQSGTITLESMRSAIKLFVVLSLISGICLLWCALGENIRIFSIFLVLGVLAITAAITYTAGKRPYGYAGLGDFSVLIFFGLIGVMGTYFLFTQSFDWTVVLPSLSCGFFSVAVLNINNIRDIESDQQAGKMSIPVRIGRANAVIYHWVLLMCGLVAAVAFVIINFSGYTQLIFLLSSPLLLMNGIAVTNKSKPADLDPYLKQMALTTLLFVITFGIGLLLT